MSKFLFIGNFDRTSVGEPEIAETLRELGHEVVKLHEYKTSIEEIKNVITDQQIDVLLLGKFRVGKVKEREEFFQWCPVPTVSWIFDLYYGL